MTQNRRLAMTCFATAQKLARGAKKYQDAADDETAPRWLRWVARRLAKWSASLAIREYDRCDRLLEREEQ